jgi:hypothetical protein
VRLLEEAQSTILNFVVVYSAVLITIPYALVFSVLFLVISVCLLVPAGDSIGLQQHAFHNVIILHVCSIVYCLLSLYPLLLEQLFPG